MHFVAIFTLPTVHHSNTVHQIHFKNIFLSHYNTWFLFKSLRVGEIEQKAIPTAMAKFQEDFSLQKQQTQLLKEERDLLREMCNPESSDPSRTARGDLSHLRNVFPSCKVTEAHVTRWTFLWEQMKNTNRRTIMWEMVSNATLGSITWSSTKKPLIRSIPLLVLIVWGGHRKFTCHLAVPSRWLLESQNTLWTSSIKVSKP